MPLSEDFPARNRPRPVITLITDFGTSDHYVGTMKCVISGICPEANIVDISHEIGPADLITAAYTLSQAVPFAPAGAVHVVVVDPGVGTARRAIAARIGAQTFVGPDNGVFTLVLGSHPDPKTVRALEHASLGLPNRSHTFHGRDLFAPAAAHIAAGLIDWDSVGSEVTDPVLLPGLTAIKLHERSWQGLILSIDRFGNVITNLPGDLLGSGSAILRVNGSTIRRTQKTFGETNADSPFLYCGSSRFVEIAINRGHAAHALRVTIGQPVTLELDA